MLVIDYNHTIFTMTCSIYLRLIVAASINNEQPSNHYFYPLQDQGCDDEEIEEKVEGTQLLSCLTFL